MSQYRNFANLRGYDRWLVIYDRRTLANPEEGSRSRKWGGGCANSCIASDAVPVFYCYVVVKFFKTDVSLTNKGEGSVDLWGRSYELLVLESW